MKIRVTHSRTKRPRGALLQLAIGSGLSIRRIGGTHRSCPRGGGGGDGEIPLLLSLGSNLPENLGGQWLAGSLTGAVASQRVTEAFKGTLRPGGNRLVSANAQGCLTARQTSRADTKVGVSDPTVPSGRAVA